MHVKQKPRRRHSEEFKALVLADCAEPGASVAAVAQSFGLNDNLVHQWRRGRGCRGEQEVAAPAAQFARLSLPSPPASAVSAVSAASPPAPVEAASAGPPAQEIHMQLKRGTLEVSVSWPVSAAAHCGAWLRELLR